jgi:hypothetical protein
VALHVAAAKCNRSAMGASLVFNQLRGRLRYPFSKNFRTVEGVLLIYGIAASDL